MSESGIISIRGRAYKTVALRVSEFRETHSIDDGWAIVTEQLSADDDCVKVCASILHPDGRQVATGLAEEKRSASQINRTSALENCETSAIGRALAAAGYGGSEYASANEVENAIQQQESPPPQRTPPPPADPIDAAVVRLLTDDRDLLKAYEPSIKNLGDARAAARDVIGRLNFEDGTSADWIYKSARGHMNAVLDERAAVSEGF